MSTLDRDKLLNTLISQTANKSVISFTAGFPDEEFFLAHQLQEAYKKVLREPNSLQYATDFKGFYPLRENIKQRLTKKQIYATEDEILLTTGSSQAIDLTARIYLKAGDTVFVENPTYQEAIRLFAWLGVKVIPIQSDKDGIMLEDFVQNIQTYQPKMVYVNPIFSNPTGKVWSLDRKKDFLALCHQYNVLILEDDPYSDLAFQNPESIPSIFSLEKNYETSLVIYISTFSKIIAPALRIGFAVARPSLLEPLVEGKALSDLQSSTLNQRAVSQLLTTFDLDAHLKKMVNHYQAKVNLMTTYLAKELGDQLHWSDPEGGIYLWIELPQKMNPQSLLTQSIQEGIVYLPGDLFYVDNPDVNAIRFNFTFPSEEKIIEGMKRFVQAYQHCK